MALRGVLWCLVLAGCSQVPSAKTQMANPASVACIQAGGRLEMVRQPQGEHGMCHLPSGDVCDEWAFFRHQPATGRCPPAAAGAAVGS